MFTLLVVLPNFNVQTKKLHNLQDILSKLN